MKSNRRIAAKLAIVSIVMGAMQVPAFSAQPAAVALNFTVDNLYISQSTQNYQRNVNLIENRGGLLRVFVRANQSNTARPDVKLNFYYNNILDPTKTKTISANALMTGIPVQINENDHTASYDVAIPASWITPNLTVTAQVDPNSIYTQAVATWPTSYALTRDALLFTDNSTRQPVVDLANFNTVLVPIVIQKTTKLLGLTFPRTLSTADLSGTRPTELVSFLRDMYPVPETIESSVHEPFNTQVNPGYLYDANWTQLLSDIDALKTSEYTGETKYYYGLFKPTIGVGGTGQGNIGGHSAIGVDATAVSIPNLFSGTYAHETGHAIGLYHAPCGGAAGPDTSFPYANASIGVWGYSIFSNKWFDPLQDSDVMSYCGNYNLNWVSDYNYKKLVTFRSTETHPELSQNGNTVGAASQEMLLIRGRTENGQIKFEPVMRVMGKPTPDEPGSSYQVVMEDTNGRKISVGIKLQDISHSTEKLFSVLVPLSTPTLANSGPANSADLSSIKSLQFLENGVSRAKIAKKIQTTQSAAASGNGATSITPTSLVRLNGNVVRLTWDPTKYAMAQVKNALTGQVIAIDRIGIMDITSSTLQVADIQLSDGLTSVNTQISVQSASQAQPGK